MRYCNVTRPVLRLRLLSAAYSVHSARVSAFAPPSHVPLSVRADDWRGREGEWRAEQARRGGAKYVQWICACRLEEAVGDAVGAAVGLGVGLSVGAAVVVVVGAAVVFGGLWQWYFSGVSVVEGGGTHPGCLLLRRRLSENVVLWLYELLVQMQSGLPGVRNTDVGSV